MTPMKYSVMMFRPGVCELKDIEVLVYGVLDIVNFINSTVSERYSESIYRIRELYNTLDSFAL